MSAWWMVMVSHKEIICKISSILYIYGDIIYMDKSRRLLKRSAAKTKKKRCPRGSRRDKKTGLCLPFIEITVFKDLKDQHISETNDTISIESLGDDGAILKVYKNGTEVQQKFVSNTKLDMVKTKGLKVAKHMIKKIKAVGENPNIMFNDKKFKNFEKKLKRFENKQSLNGGGEGGEGKGTKEEHVNIIIQEDVLNKLQDNHKINKLQEKLKNLEQELSDERNHIKQELLQQRDTFWAFGLPAIIDAIELTTHFEIIWLRTIFSSTFIMDTIELFAPNLQLFYLDYTLKFALYSFLTISSFLSLLSAGFTGTTIMSFLLSIYAFTKVSKRYVYITQPSKEKNEKEIKLELEIQETKKELYELVEKVSV